MKKYFLFLVILFGLFGLAKISLAATYYVSTSGNNSTGDGSSAKPWATLSYACGRVTSTGDTIHLTAGTYNENSVCNLSSGVSIEGPAADFSYLNFNTAPTVAISHSVSPVVRIGSAGSYTNGNNQEIRYLRFVSSGASMAVKAEFRHNVKVRNCQFSGYPMAALEITAQTSHAVPAAWLTGIEVYDNKITDSGGSQGSWTSGALHIDGTTGARIYRNLIDNLTANRRGIGIKACVYDGYNKGLLIYENTIKVPENNAGGGGGAWCVAIETWYGSDESQIYGNRIFGEINHDTLSKGAGAYSLAIHDNEIGYDSTPSSLYARALTFDGGITGLKVYGNYFHHSAGGLFFNPGGTSDVKDLQVYNNIFYAMGQTQSGGHQKILCDNGMTYNNVKIYHNTVYIGGGTGAVPYAGWDVQGSNIDVSNNICVGATGGPWLTLDTSGGSNYVRNNMLYGNNNNNSESGSGAYTKSGNIIATPGIQAGGSRPDPYFRPLANGNLVDKGVNVGLVYSGSAPDIGAYEYISGTTPPPTTKKGDLNSDSKVDIIDLGIFLSNWGITTRPVSDINQDSKVDIVDLGILLSNWG